MLKFTIGTIESIYKLPIEKTSRNIFISDPAYSQKCQILNILKF